MTAANAPAGQHKGRDGERRSTKEATFVEPVWGSEMNGAGQQIRDGSYSVKGSMGRECPQLSGSKLVRSSGDGRAGGQVVVGE